jgi:6-phosphogluconolactonase (cycloisomerase 2 family)
MTVTELHVISVDGRREGGAPATISSYRMLRDGSLQTISNSTAINEGGSCWVRFSRDGSFVYTADTLSGTISTLSVSPQGELTLHSVVASGGGFSGPIDMDITADGKFLYVVNALALVGNSPPILPAPANPGRVQGFRIQDDGTLVPITTVGGIPLSAQGLVAH